MACQPTKMGIGNLQKSAGLRKRSVKEVRTICSRLLRLATSLHLTTCFISVHHSLGSPTHVMVRGLGAPFWRSLFVKGIICTHCTTSTIGR